MHIRYLSLAVRRLLCALLAAAIIAGSFLPPFQSTAYAWKPRSHVYLAELAALDALDGDGRVTIYRVTHDPPGIVFDSNGKAEIVGTYSVVEENLEALEHLQQYFAGTIGPDAYPDIATGQQSIHPDNSTSGPDTDQWLEHLWNAASSPKYRDSRQVRAFVLGFLAHAAGDMYGHTFINHYSGGEFELGYNAVKHVVLEGYVDKRTPSPANQGFSISGVDEFIYDAMIDVRPDENPLSPPLYGEGSEFSFPAEFSALRLVLERDVRDYHNKLADYDRIIKENRDRADECYRYNYVCQGIWNGKAEAAQLEKDGFAAGSRGWKGRYFESWISDIEDGLREWPQLNHDLAAAITYNANGMDFDRATDLGEEYLYQHLISMAGAPDEVGIFAEVIDEATDEILGAFPKLRAAVDEMKKDLYFYLIKQATGVDAEEEIEEWKAYLTSPEVYFDEVMSAGEGVPLTLEELNRDVLQLDDDGFGNPSDPETYKYWEFPAAYNTVTMIKLSLMEPSEVRRLMADLGSPLADDPDLWGANFTNVMLGYLKTLDGDNQWCSNNDDMIVAQDPVAYAQIFMRQKGQKIVSDCPDYSNPVRPPNDASCTYLGPTQLQIGGRAIVDPNSQLANRVRSRADASAAIVGRIAPGEGMTILNGPMCDTQYIWWNVRSDGGINGWTVEGGATSYWLIPERKPSNTPVQSPAQSPPPPSQSPLPGERCFALRRPPAHAQHVMQRYGINEQCSVGSIVYYLVDGEAPRGKMDGEDCVAFDPADIEARTDLNAITDTSTNKVLFYPVGTEQQVLDMYSVILNRGFTYACYISRGSPGETYLRR